MTLFALLLALCLSLMAVTGALVAFAYLRRLILLRRAGGVFVLPTPVLLRLLLQESIALWRVSLWRFWPHRLADAPDVLLIHGLWADGSSLTAFADALHDRGLATAAPPLGRIGRPIEAYADALAKHISDVPKPVHVVSHSMGSMVLRQALARHPGLSERIRSVVSVASPHEGTLAAQRIPLPEARALVPGSVWLKQLPTLQALLPTTPRTYLASDADAIVFPTSSAVPAGERSAIVPGLGHAQTLTAPAMIAAVVDAVLRNHQSP